MNLREEHAKFIATGYTEERWQQVLESRRTWRLRQQALRDWDIEQSEAVPEVPEITLTKQAEQHGYGPYKPAPRKVIEQPKPKDIVIGVNL